MASPINDNFGAVFRFDDIHLSGSRDGPLAGSTFVAKDTFDVAGYRTGNGNPDWRATHAPAVATAPLIEMLVAAGATLVGKSHCDELCFSIEGENAHYGTPMNPAAPTRVPGGSSSGSAVAVAAGLVDFAIGSDAGGSVRLPASFCGCFGIRPTHGRVPSLGVTRLAPSVGTLGWFARDAEVLGRVGAVVLGEDSGSWFPRQIVLVKEAFDLADPRLRAHLAPPIARIAERLGARASEADIAGGTLDEWFACLRTIQGAEAWESYGEWITSTKPDLGPAIRARFDWAASIDPEVVPARRRQRADITADFEALIGTDVLLVFPTAPGPAPLLATPPSELDPYRTKSLEISAIAGLSGIPQVSIPCGAMDGAPVGLSFAAARFADRELLHSVARCF